jgi:hypothetical protein
MCTGCLWPSHRGQAVARPGCDCTASMHTPCMLPTWLEALICDCTPWLILSSGCSQPLPLAGCYCNSICLCSASCRHMVVAEGCCSWRPVDQPIVCSLCISLLAALLLHCSFVFQKHGCCFCIHVLPHAVLHSMAHVSGIPRTAADLISRTAAVLILQPADVGALCCTLSNTSFWIGDTVAMPQLVSTYQPNTDTVHQAKQLNIGQLCLYYD